MTASDPKPHYQKRQRKRAKSLNRASHRETKPAKPREMGHPNFVIAKSYTSDLHLPKPAVDPDVIKRAYERLFKGIQ
mgnify:CR=1 FL=1